MRRAVEVLIQTIDRIDRDRGRVLLRGTDEKVLYESAVTVMMRLVFLFAAEEQNLLLPGDPLHDQHYAVSTLREELQAVADQHGPEVLRRRHDAWSRLLATFRAVHGGVRHDEMRLPANAGSLFDPDRFPFLEGRAAGTDWRRVKASPLPIDNLTVLDVLSSLQVLQLKLPGGGAESRRLLFRALDVEQIGHVYEGLLDHTTKRARTPVLSLRGSKDLEPEIEVAELEKQRAKGDEALVDFLVEQTGRSRPAVEKAIAHQIPEKNRRRYLIACDNDECVFERIAPWAGLIREDVHGRPVIFREGSVYVTAGSERRTTGAHYTPKSLTEPIVRHTLEPLVYEGPAVGRPKEKWKLRTAREILALRVCDLAMGSGAFLVQACRYLAERVVEAWDEAERAAGGRPVVTPEGDVSTGSPAERPLPRGEDERLAIARRIVADRCLYGVDKNPMAVEMARLSLWLVTLQKDQPFTFVDHALRVGDSLLGVTEIAQLESFHLDPLRGRDLHTTPFDPTRVIRPAINRAVHLRQEIARRLTQTREDALAKERLLDEARRSTDDLRLAADVLVGAALATATRGAKAFDDKLILLSAFVREFLSDETTDDARSKLRADLRAEADELLNEGRGPDHGERLPFHWAIELPEVFAGGRTGFDAFIGNPPFMVGFKLQPLFGSDWRAFVVEWLARGVTGVRGGADLCAYFMLRSQQLAASHCRAGLVATSTIGEGDSREVGLQRLVSSGWTIVGAVPSMRWPGAANLHVALLWLSAAPDHGPRLLNGEHVGTISPLLDAGGTAHEAPKPLLANAQRAFLGSKVEGMGFAVTASAAAALIATDAKNRLVLHPFFNGDDLNNLHDQVARRWVIHFRDWPLDRDTAPPDYTGYTASDFPDCLTIVRRDVLPYRASLPPTTPWNRKLSSKWWQFGQDRIALYPAKEGLRRVLVAARVSKHLTFAFIDASVVYSEQVVVVASDRLTDFAVLQSSIHETWARAYGSTLDTRPRYTPSTSFETFPFPHHLGEALEGAGAAYNRLRGTIARRRSEGATVLYNRFHDLNETSDDIADLRTLQAAMDRAVAVAYRWTDLDLGHGFHETKRGLRYTISETARREVLDRLLELNHRRHAEEVARGLHDTGKKAKAPNPKPFRGDVLSSCYPRDEPRTPRRRRAAERGRAARAGRRAR